MSQVKPIPDGYHSVTPSLVVPDSRLAIELYKKTFDAQQVELVEHGGTVMHAEIRIGSSVVMLADANPDWGLQSPAELGGSPVSLYLYVEDVDTLAMNALAHGFEELMPVSDMFWGDRFAQVKDPFGHIWSLATHIEDVDEAEINRRMREFAEQSNE